MAMLRLNVGTFSLYSVDWRPIVLPAACWLLVVGSIAAVVQTDVKRMLAYSSITHAGYVLIAVQAATAKGTSAALFYVLTYAVMTIGAFAVVEGSARVTTTTRSPTIEESRGRQPLLAALLTLFLLAGRRAAHRRVRREAVGVQRGDRRRPVAARARGHARVGDRRVRLPAHRARDVRAVRRRGAGPDPRLALVDLGTRTALTLSAAGVLFLGIVPWGMLDFAKHATQLLTH